MNWEAIGAISDLLAALAVVVSLVYVGIQIRQNTIEMRNSSTQSLVEHRTDANFLIAENESLAALLAIAVQGLDQLEPHQQFRFKTYCFAFFNQFDIAYYQYQSGRLEERFWRRMDLEIPVVLQMPGIAAWWEQEKVRFTQEFVAHVESRLTEFQVPENEDWSEISNNMFVEAKNSKT